MQVEKIETGRFLIILSEDEKAVIQAIQGKVEFTQEVIMARSLSAMLRSIYHLWYPSKLFGGE